MLTFHIFITLKVSHRVGHCHVIPHITSLGKGENLKYNFYLVFMLTTTIQLKKQLGAGDIAQWLRAFIDLQEDLVLICSTHTAVHNCNSSYRRSPFSGLCGHQAGRWYTDVHAG